MSEITQIYVEHVKPSFTGNERVDTPNMKSPGTGSA